MSSAQEGHTTTATTTEDGHRTTRRHDTKTGGRGALGLTGVTSRDGGATTSTTLTDAPDARIAETHDHRRAQMPREVAHAARQRDRGHRGRKRRPYRWRCHNIYTRANTSARRHRGRPAWCPNRPRTKNQARQEHKRATQGRTGTPARPTKARHTRTTNTTTTTRRTRRGITTATPGRNSSDPGCRRRRCGQRRTRRRAYPPPLSWDTNGRHRLYRHRRHQPQARRSYDARLPRKPPQRCKVRSDGRQTPRTAYS